MLPVLELHVNGIIHDVFYWVWLLSPSHVPLYYRGAYTSLLIAVQCPSVQVCKDAFTVVSASGRGGSFLFGTTVEPVAVDTLVPWWTRLQFCPVCV